MLCQPANMPFKAFKATIYISKVFFIKSSAKKAKLLQLCNFSKQAFFCKTNIYIRKNTEKHLKYYFYTGVSQQNYFFKENSFFPLI